MNDQLLFLEDLYVGQCFESHTCLVSADSIKKFASEFDPQPFHLDEKTAENSFFKTLINSGWNTAALTVKMVVDSVKIANGIIGVNCDVSWPKPVYPGDSLRVVSEVKEITPSRSKPDRGVVVLQSETFNQKNEIVQNLVAKLIVKRKG